jgi:nucleoside-diphosphate-sugar epimerase
MAAAAFVLETTLRPLGIQPLLHRRRLDFFRKSFRLDGSKAQELLGFTPKVGFNEGILRTSPLVRAGRRALTAQELLKASHGHRARSLAGEDVQ